MFYLGYSEIYDVETADVLNVELWPCEKSLELSSREWMRTAQKPNDELRLSAQEYDNANRVETG